MRNLGEGVVRPRYFNSTGLQLRQRVKILGLTLLAFLAISTQYNAGAQSAEFGVQYDTRGVAAFVYITDDFLIGSIGESGLWFSPSVEVVLGQSFIDGFLQAQFLWDMPWATFSLRGKVEAIDQRTRGELRLGILIGR